jgi:hypothetical protein
MQKEAMIKCLVNGKIISLTKKGFEMAKEYFGAVPADDMQTHEIPIELRQPIIIPSKPLKVEQKVDIPIEIKKVIAVKEPEVESQINPEEIKPVANQEIKTEIIPAKKIVRRPRKGGKK